MERLHNGSSEEGWPKEGSKEILAEEKHREKRRQEDSEEESDQKAALAEPSEKQESRLAAGFPVFPVLILYILARINGSNAR